METEENKKLSAEHSIEIIRETIEQSRKVITRNCAITLLTWGILICVTATVIGLLWSYTNSYYCNLGWIVMVFIGLLINSKMIIEEETAGVSKSFINDITKNIWRTFAVVIFTSIVASQVTNFGNDPIAQELPISATINICMTFAAIMTGIVLKSEMISLFACSGSYASIKAALDCNGPEEMAAVIFGGMLMMVIPGAIALYRNRKPKGRQNEAKLNEKEQ